MRIATLHEMAQHPAGRFTLHGGIAHFCLEPRFWGVLLWGRTISADMQSTVRSLALELSADAVPHVSLVDVSRVTSFEPGAFDVLGEYVAGHFDALAQRVQRLAVVRPSAGIVSAVVAGFFEVVASPYPVAHFADTKGALAWLELDDVEQTLEVLAGVVADASKTPPLLSAVKAAIASHLVSAASPHVARALGMSERTLQRRLAEHDTSFNRLLTDVRLEAAQQRMLDSDEPLTAIALDAGFSSTQHFSISFRRAIGQSPSDWRRQHKRG